MPKKREERSPSQEEFLAVIDSEFGFLVTEEGYKKKVVDQFEVEFMQGEKSLRVLGETYGLSARVGFKIKGRDIPWFQLLPKEVTSAPRPRTDMPQLDDLRLQAGWLKGELRGLVRGGRLSWIGSRSPWRRRTASGRGSRGPCPRGRRVIFLAKPTGSSGTRSTPNASAT